MAGETYSEITFAEALEIVEAGEIVEFKYIVDAERVHDFTFKSHVRFSNCDFTALDLSGCRFDKGFAFVGCIFEGRVSFEGARAASDCHFRACTFNKEARFDRLRVDGKLEVRAPRNTLPLKGNRHRNSANGRELQLPPYVTFKEHVNFPQIFVTGEANFGSAQFCNGVDFYNARIEGPAFFRKDSCREYQEGNKTIGFADELFKPTRFGAKKTRDPDVRVRFRDAFFGGELNFYRATFECLADFSYVRCQGMAFFCNPRALHDTLDNESCEFEQAVDFEGARFANSLRLDKCRFSGTEQVRFQDCRVTETLAFGDVPEKLCMTGCSYKRLQCSKPDDYPEAIKRYEDTKNQFDRSSWIQLEATLRNSGSLNFADRVYRQRMCQERKHALSVVQRAFSYLWQGISGFGTSQRGLIAVCLVVLATGIPVFYTGSLKKSSKETPAASCVSQSFDSAAAVSLYYFSPLKLPVAEDCTPDGWRNWFAAFEKITGWILVPLLAANLTGLLHRKAKSKLEASDE